VADLLLVDNDLRLSELLAFFLRKRGHEVRTSPSYADARARIAERHPELMLADLELGRERGREELERMERDGDLPRTLVVSGYLDAETETWIAGRPRIVGALRKPFELDALEDAVRRATIAVAGASCGSSSNHGATVAPSRGADDRLLGVDRLTSLRGAPAHDADDTASRGERTSSSEARP
jgi:DNA-binding NtrC family response regulator